MCRQEYFRLPLDIITPEELPNSAPSTEEFLQQRLNVRTLETQQTELLDCQSDLDDAVERLDSGKLTVNEYDDLRKTAPDSVRPHIPGMEISESEPSVNAPLDLSLDAELANVIQLTVPGLVR